MGGEERENEWEGGRNTKEKESKKKKKKTKIYQNNSKYLYKEEYMAGEKKSRKLFWLTIVDNQHKMMGTYIMSEVGDDDTWRCDDDDDDDDADDDRLNEYDTCCDRWCCCSFPSCLISCSDVFR